ncbi:MAG TPA: DUF1236 domain-containing protein [Pseudolabrys sp.]|nr:DUF1236 domain-containing protein [Pseudolabrys sp.]
MQQLTLKFSIIAGVLMSASAALADDLRGPAGFSPQESSPANGGINLPSTTGQGSAAGATRLSPATRNEIVTIFRDHRVASAQLDRPVRAGAQIPTDMHSYPVPKEVADVVPQWRGYNYIMSGDETLVVDPATRAIVAIVVNR